MAHNSVTDKYKRYLLLEKGLSKNTIEAYLADLEKLTDFIEAAGLSVQQITYNNLETFVAELHDQKIAPRSVARIISGV
ncbi:MAG: site-specific integrase, partial [Petrimonas sp.]|nr:site-specific integrase [Petrimonas sp.]